MKILACVGSYRKNGNTARVVDLIQGQMQKEAVRIGESLEIETLFLSRQNTGLCRGCRVCFDKGEEKCPLKDDLLAIKAKILEADGMIVASPVYVDDVSGTMKNWIDRLAHVCHRPEFAGKSVYLVATTGSSPTGHAIRTLRTAMMTWGCYVVGETGFKMGALMPKEELEARYGRQARHIARRFFYAVHQRKFARPSFLSLMMFKIQQRAYQQADRDTIDFSYWQNQGWLEPRREFYIEHHANPLKASLARLAGLVVARLVS
jgi:multimeric flavodoxin WrbA